MNTFDLGPFRVRPRGTFDPSKNYRYLDLVTYDGGSYICSNYDTIDGVACIGVLPTGEANSEMYWQCVAERGEGGLIEVEDLPIGTLEEGSAIWDFDVTDKLYIPEDFTQRLNIVHAYDGCIGVILTSNRNLLLPANSDFAIDFNYAEITNANEYYLYTFICADMGGGSKFIWNRTVIRRS